jgi:hypothetical protein
MSNYVYFEVLLIRTIARERPLELDEGDGASIRLHLYQKKEWWISKRVHKASMKPHEASTKCVPN